MSIHTSFFIVLLAFASLALCQKPAKKVAHKGHFVSGPSYLVNLTKAEKKEYFGIFLDKTLTIRQQEEKKLAFAVKHGFGPVIEKDMQFKDANRKIILEERPLIIEHLQEANKQLLEIYGNKDQTVAQQIAAVNALRKKYPHTVPTLYFMSRLITSSKLHPKLVHH